MLRRCAHVRRSFVRAAFALLCSDDECVIYRQRVRSDEFEVRVRRYRGGVIAGLERGVNYDGGCWRTVDPATGWPGAPAFAIRRGTGELIGRDGEHSLMPFK